jgi:hypothetical protein
VLCPRRGPAADDHQGKPKPNDTQCYFIPHSLFALAIQK